VDDDSSVRRALRQFVKSAGDVVATFASVGEFLDSSPRGRSACLVLDIQMARMSGFDLQERLAAERSAISVIFITAHHARREDAEILSSWLPAEIVRRSGFAPCHPRGRRISVTRRGIG
jgi:DNA-binding NtrC family response regulator